MDYNYYIYSCASANVATIYINKHVASPQNGSVNFSVKAIAESVPYNILEIQHNKKPIYNCMRYLHVFLILGVIDALLITRIHHHKKITCFYMEMGSIECKCC
jgi:hypothetical protein